MDKFYIVNLLRFSFFCFFFLIFSYNILGLDLNDSWNQSNGVIYNPESSIWPIYAYGDCPNFDIDINGVNKKTESLFRFSKTSNSHVSLPGESSLERALCVATSGLGSVEVLEYGDYADFLEVSLAREGNSHLITTGGGVKIPIYLSGVDAFRYTLITKLQSDPPGLNYSCIGSINGDDSQGYHYGDCNYNPVKRIWVALEEDFKVWLNAPYGTELQEKVYVEELCYGNSVLCNDSSLKLYHSDLLISVCPLDPELYTIDNFNNFSESGWVCGIGYSENGKYSVTNPIKIDPIDFWISSNYNGIIKTDSLSKQIEIETNKNAYCELSNEGSLYSPFISDVSQYGIERYSLSHETNLQLNENDLGVDKEFVVRCYEEGENDYIEKNFMIRLTDLEISLQLVNNVRDLFVFKDQLKVFNLSIKDSSNNSVYGLKSSQFDSIIKSNDNNDVYIGLVGVFPNEFNYSLNLNSQLDVGNYNLSVSCINGIKCIDYNSWNLTVLDSSLTVLMSTDVTDTKKNSYSSVSGDSVAVLTGDDLYYDESTGSISASDGVNLFVSDSSEKVSTIIDYESDNPTYLIVSDEDITWIVDEYKSTGEQILLRYVGRDEDGNRIIKVEYI